jgi:hypothetical protein
MQTHHTLPLTEAVELMPPIRSACLEASRSGEEAQKRAFISVG